MRGNNCEGDILESADPLDCCHDKNCDVATKIKKGGKTRYKSMKNEIFDNLKFERVERSIEEIDKKLRGCVISSISPVDDPATDAICIQLTDQTKKVSYALMVGLESIHEGHNNFYCAISQYE